jgi:hypothetical protein
MKELGYDQMFHLYMLVTLADGTTIRLGKNAIPQMTIGAKNPKESILVSSPGNSFADFIGKTIQRMGEKDYVQYDGATLNCQNFIQNHLQANGISTAESTKFIMQDAEKLLTGRTRSIARGITDIGATVTQAIGGRKKKKHTERKQSARGLERPDLTTSSAIVMKIPKIIRIPRMIALGRPRKTIRPRNGLRSKQTGRGPIDDIKGAIQDAKSLGRTAMTQFRNVIAKSTPEQRQAFLNSLKNLK